MSQHADSPVRIPFAEGTRDGACIKVISVGGGGNNAINRMIDLGLDGVEFISVNTDLQSFMSSKAQVRLQLGARLTHGLGAGADAELGLRAAREESYKLAEALDGAEMVFITVGLGGGTGTGVAPIVASVASQLGALTVAVVTLPFAFEGKRRMNRAERGLQQLLDHVDTVIVIPNDRLLADAKDIGFFESFQIADDILRQAVQGISDILTIPGVINRDFADIKTTMEGMGYGVIGTASRSGPHRASDAAIAAITSPLLAPGAIGGALGVLITITGSNSLRLSEVHEASTIIQRAAHEDANIIFGAVLDDRLGAEVKVTVIATGFDQKSREHAQRRLFTRDSVGTTKTAVPVQSSAGFATAMRSSAPTAVHPQQKKTKPTLPQTAAKDSPERTHLPVTSSGSPAPPDNFGPVVPTPPEKSIPEHLPQFLINGEKQSEDSALPRTAESPFEEDLLAFIEGVPFDLGSADRGVSSSSAPEILLETEMARVRRAAMAAYAATTVPAIVRPDLDNHGAASFAEILRSRRQIHGVDQTESDHLFDEDARQGELIVSRSGYYLSEERPLNEVESEAGTPGFRPLGNETLEPSSASRFVDSAYVDSANASTPLAIELVTPETSLIPLEKTKKKAADFNQKLHREPDFSMGVEVI